MCEPKYFKITVSGGNLNPYMDTENQPNPIRVYEQVSELCFICRDIGIEKSFLPPVAGLYDQVFTANVAWRVDGILVMANMKTPWRKKEVPIAEGWLVSHGYKVLRLPENIFFEGQGNIITTKRAHLYGHGVRNSAEVPDELRKLLDLKKPVIDLELPSSSCFDIDLVFSYSGEKADKFLWYPGAFDEESNRKIEKMDAEKMEVGENFFIQNVEGGGRNFPLNSIYHNGVQVFPWDEKTAPFPKKIKEFVEAGGMEVVTLNFSEFGKSGGGIFCCTLFLG